MKKHTEHTKTTQFVCVTKPDTLGVVDITDMLPKACAKCPHMEFMVSTHKIYNDDMSETICVEVVCSKRHTCNYIMEMMKCDE